jgi:hypothetical protein
VKCTDSAEGSYTKGDKKMMHRIIMVAAIAAVAACSDQGTTTTADDTNMTTANDAMTTAAPALASINETTWEYTQDGKPMQLSVDASGNYIITSGSEHIDHGTATMRDGKACYTSAMTSEGELCWTDPRIDVGGSGETVNDQGEALQVNRVAYVPKTM